MFNVVDVVLSAALLAGGANGIHSVVSSITTFFDSNAQKEEELWQGCITGVAGEVMMQCAPHAGLDGPDVSRTQY
jgi:hypothetical protein